MTKSRFQKILSVRNVGPKLMINFIVNKCKLWNFIEYVNCRRFKKIQTTLKKNIKTPRNSTALEWTTIDILVHFIPFFPQYTQTTDAHPYTNTHVQTTRGGPHTQICVPPFAPNIGSWSFLMKLNFINKNIKFYSEYHKLLNHPPFFLPLRLFWIFWYYK